MRRIGSSWVVAGSLRWALLLSAAGCSQAIYTLGQLSADSQAADASTSDAPIGGNDASGGTAGSGGAGGMAGAAGAGGSAGTVACQPRTMPAVRRGLNLYLMVDSSFGIAVQPVWPQVTQAISMFMDDPSNAGIGLGINYFGTSCFSGVYAMPRVAVAPLPGVAESIRASTPLPIDGVAASIAAPVDGAVLYASSLEDVQADRETDVVLVSDGLFDPGCGEGTAEAILYAAAGFTSRPSIRTHVIAIDSGFFDPLNTVDLTPLHDLAAAGGTLNAHTVQVNLTSTAQLLDALMQVKDNATPCAFNLPAGFDGARTIVEWRPSGAPNEMPMLWTQVNDASACTTRTAVYRPPGSNHLQLCPNACLALDQAANGTAQLREECP